jgi:hypothetical protein
MTSWLDTRTLSYKSWCGTDWSKVLFSPTGGGGNKKKHTHTQKLTNRLTDYLQADWLTDWVERSLSWKVIWFAAGQEIPCNLWNTKVHDHANKSPPFFPCWATWTHDTSTHPTSLSTIVTWPSHLSLSLYQAFSPHRKIILFSGLSGFGALSILSCYKRNSLSETQFPSSGVKIRTGLHLAARRCRIRYNRQSPEADLR